MMNHRASGVLLHITSLPSQNGVGDLGPTAFRFVDLLSESRQRYWLVLPLTPTSLSYGNSPYKTDSAFAGNPLLISPEPLEEEDLLEGEPYSTLPRASSHQVDYAMVTESKAEMLVKAYDRFKMNRPDHASGFEDFCEKNSNWLNDYALYKALKGGTGKPWYLWPASLRDREKNTIAEKTKELKDPIEFEKFVQFMFFRQWQTLKKHCERKMLRILGDLSFYVSYDSADVWVNQEMFKLDSEKRPFFVAGVPPDYFSTSGQFWGNPIYDWGKLAETQFEWWMNRIEHSLKLYDTLRLDHFRGFLSCWEIPYGEQTAVNGKWVKTPSEEFFETLRRRFPKLPFVAEDLGLITEDVREAVNRLGIPGMRVLIFGFSNHMKNPNTPHNFVPNSVVFTGTHDTNTTRGWFTQEATLEEKHNVFRYLGKNLSEEEVSWRFISLVMGSVSDLSIIPMQDILSLGAEARMNQPANEEGNWQWRVTMEQMVNGALSRLGEMTEDTGRI